METFELITIIIGIIALSFTAFQISKYIKVEKAKISFDLINNFNNPNIRKEISEAMQFFTDGAMSEEKMKSILFPENKKDTDFEMRIKCSLFTSFFESVGQAYNSGMGDKKILKDFFTSVSVPAHNFANMHYIKLAEEKLHHKNLDKNWKEMNNKF